MDKPLVDKLIDYILYRPTKKPKVFAVDFDGYCCDSAWPNIGKPHRFILWYYKRKKRQGHKLILNTCRERELLQNAIDWCAGHGLYFDAHNENLPEIIALYGRGDCRKISADYYGDDKNHWLRPIRWR